MTDLATSLVPDRTAELAPGSARSLLLTILGELVWPSESPAWTSALLYVMGGLGVEEAAARQAIMRGSASGWIVPSRHGREVSWTLTPHFEQVFETGSKRVISLADPFVGWDGSWLVLFVTVPHALRATRKRLYRDLTWAGFGNPSAGVWLSPHPERRDQVAELIDELGLGEYTMSFVGKADAVGLSERDIVRRGWDLSDLAERYAAMDERFRGATPEPGDDTLFTHLRLLGEWQAFPFSDPQLPEALAPDWIGREVSSRIESLRERWSVAAHDRWSQINSAGGAALPL